LNSFYIFFTASVFVFTVMFLVLRPRGINEAIPPAVGAFLLISAGVVPLADLLQILDVISGAVITIMTTIIMSLVLDSIGFFRWTAVNIIKAANGSGRLLYWYICLLCFLMTLFFNNDGSILITTPIIIQMLSILNLKTHEKLPYLFAGVLVDQLNCTPCMIYSIFASINAFIR
jgi:arsenical pump membrane protein